MTVRVREHERELAAFAKEHPNWKRKSKPKAWNIESSDATSFEEHQKEARAAAARAYAKEQLRKKESLDTTSFEEHQEEARRADARAYAKDMVNRHQRLMDETRVYAKKNRDTKGFKWAFDGKDWVKIDESKIEEFSKNFLETEWTEKDTRDIDLLFQRKLEELVFREKELRDTALKKRGFDPARYASMSRDELDAILALLDATAEERDAEVYPTLEPDLEEIYMLFGKVSLDSMKFALARTNRVFERLDYLKSLGYGNPRTSEERIIWLNNYDNMVVQATETDVKARLKYWRLWKRELEPYERDYWVSLFKRMWKAQMNGVVENRLGL